MNWSVARVNGPGVEVLTTTDAKKHLHVEHNDEDAYIAGLARAAREQIEEECNRTFVRQTWDFFRDDFPGGRDPIELPRGPLISVTSVKYTTVTSTAVQTLSATAYYVDSKSEPARIGLRHGQVWPTNLLRAQNGVEVRFVAGMATASTTATGVPRRVRQTVQLMVGAWYTDREGVNPNVDRAVRSLKASLDARRYT